MRIAGVDFTCAPRPAKPIVAACGELRGDTLRLEAIERMEDWPAFEAWLRAPGPWIAGFDFPFGLPREAVEALGWPTDWAALVRHCAGLGRAHFREALDRHRAGRPAGQRYEHRRTDRPAGSHSPLKLVHPPVGLMFLEGAPRLLAAGVHLPGIRAGDARRVGVEAYPGRLARGICNAPYKHDTRSGQSADRERTRGALLEALQGGGHPLRLRLEGPPGTLRQLIDDPRGDCLDAVLAMTQAAWCAQRAAQGWGLPAGIDPLEGWIATA